MGDEALAKAREALKRMSDPHLEKSSRLLVGRQNRHRIPQVRRDWRHLHAHGAPPGQLTVYLRLERGAGAFGLRASANDKRSDRSGGRADTQVLICGAGRPAWCSATTRAIGRAVPIVIPLPSLRRLRARLSYTRARSSSIGRWASANAFVEEGLQFKAVNLWVRGRLAHAALAEIGSD